MAAGPRRALRVLFVAWIVLGLVAPPAAATHLANSTEVNGPVPIAAADGPNVTITGSANVSLTDAFPDQNTVEIISDEGNATFISDGPTDLAVAATEINGTWTNVSQLDVTTNELYIDPGDKSAVNVSGDTDSLSINETIAIDDGGADFVYAGTSGTTTVTVRGLPANTVVAAVDADTDTVLDIDTTDGSGVGVFASMPNSEHTVELESSSESPETSATAGSGGYDISTAQFVHSVDVGSEGVSKTSMAMSRNGTKMFVAEAFDDKIDEYDLSEPFNVSTATYSQSLDVSGKETNVEGVSFSNDGSKLFITGSSSDSVHSYTLGTPYDISTASYFQSFDVSSQTASPAGLTMNATGNRMYIVSGLDDRVYDYVVASDFDISTASFAGSYDVRGEESAAEGVTINESGTSMFIVGPGSGEVNQYTLSTPFDVSSASPHQSVDVSGQDINPTGITFNGSGDRMYIVGNSNEAIYEYELVRKTPLVDNGSASPTGVIGDSKQTLSIDVEDYDFDDIKGDSVDVEFFVEGSSIGTDTLTANGTATQAHTFSKSGDVNWSVTATDKDGLTNTSQNFTVTTPSGLAIREETAPDEYLDGVTVNITAYWGEDNVATRPVTDGNLSLAGFPIDQPIIVRANATGYYPRTFVIENIFEQESMYMLNRSVPTYLVRFNLQDPTGNYPSDETALFVDRDLNQSTSVTWRPIAGDTFGTKGVPVYLEQEERFRLRIKNLETGDLAVVGSFTAIQSETVTISAGSPSIDVPTADRDYYWSVEENETGQYILFEYTDEAEQTDSVKITIHERFNESNVLVDNETFTGSNNIVYQKSMTSAQTNATWMAELYIDRGNGYQHYRVPLGSGPRSILPSGLDEVWVTGVGVFILLIVGMAFSQLNNGVGAITTALVGGLLWYLGVLAGPATGAAVVVSIAIGAAVHYRNQGVGF